MQISKEKFNELCELSRLEFSESEREEISKTLKVLTDMMDELDLPTIEGYACCERVTDSVNALRPDEVKPSLDRRELLKNATDSDGVYFVVPKVMEQ